VDFACIMVGFEDHKRKKVLCLFRYHRNSIKKPAGQMTEFSMAPKLPDPFKYFLIFKIDHNGCEMRPNSRLAHRLLSVRCMQVKSVRDATGT
jgi:hypothetical protein